MIPDVVQFPGTLATDTNSFHNHLQAPQRPLSSQLVTSFPIHTALRPLLSGPNPRSATTSDHQLPVFFPSTYPALLLTFTPWTTPTFYTFWALQSYQKNTPSHWAVPTHTSVLNLSHILVHLLLFPAAFPLDYPSPQDPG